MSEPRRLNSPGRREKGGERERGGERGERERGGERGERERGGERGERVGGKTGIGGRWRRPRERICMKYGRAYMRLHPGQLQPAHWLHPSPSLSSHH